MKNSPLFTLYSLLTKIMFEQFTLGIEEEFQIVDPQSRELKSHVSEILEEGKMLLGEKNQAGNDSIND